MIYEFKCKKHGIFEVNQSINEEHKAKCPVCKQPGQRLFSSHEVIWAGSVYREDGSRREEKDYAILKG
ncbi:MAG: zinc ribbon domain-containing protein [Dehalococcoidales bacterium]|nr:zinc ribbon domain-containing protein [Dehalococcoidales bacterium]